MTEKSKGWRFKLRSILIAVSVVVLLLPLGGIYFFRIYENELVKQTELELISQAAFIGAVYKGEVSRLLREAGGRSPYGIKLNRATTSDDYYRPVIPELNLSGHKVKPRPHEAMKTALQGDPIALVAGIHLASILLDAQRTTLSGIRILDYQGIVVAGRSDIGLSLTHLEEVQLALTGRYASSIRERQLREASPALASISRGAAIRVFTAFPIVLDDRLIGVALLSRTPKNILQHLYSEKEQVILIGIFVLLLALAVVVFASYTVARPLHALIEQTQRFAKGDKAALEPLESPVTEEVALLSESFTEMARSLEHRAEYIRNFATHVSHEFKTPLAAIQGAIELLEEHLDEMPEEKRARFLRNISQDADRLKKLVDRLLEMARADVLRPSLENTGVDWALAKLVERYKDYGLAVTLNGEKGVNAVIAVEVLETIFANLLDNSCQNGADHVQISVRCSNGSLSVTVADNGNGISPSNSEKIFTPFFTTHREDGGTGLGLGIVKSLLRPYGGDISLGPSEKGAVFVVSIPAARS